MEIEPEQEYRDNLVKGEEEIRSNSDSENSRQEAEEQLTVVKIEEYLSSKDSESPFTSSGYYWYFSNSDSDEWRRYRVAIDNLFIIKDYDRGGLSQEDVPPMSSKNLTLYRLLHKHLLIGYLLSALSSDLSIIIREDALDPDYTPNYFAAFHFLGRIKANFPGAFRTFNCALSKNQYNPFGSEEFGLDKDLDIKQLQNYLKQFEETGEDDPRERISGAKEFVQSFYNKTTEDIRNLL